MVARWHRAAGMAAGALVFVWMMGCETTETVVSGCTSNPPLEAGSTLPEETGAPIPLPAPSLDGGQTLRHTLASRRSKREFEQQPVSLAQLSQLLWAGQGITEPGGLRTAPSAGALYPFEIYFVAQRVEGLEPGLYHYHIGSHELGLVRAGDLAAELQLIALDQECVGDAAVSFVLVGVVPRTSVKYGVRATQYVLIEAGAIVQSVLLTAVDIGLGGVCVGAFHDDQMQSFIGTDALPTAILALGLPAP